MYIKRALEDTIRYNFSKSKSLAITGARQTGKTTVTKHIYPDVRRINMKDNRLVSIAEDDPFSFLNSFDRPLFIDEVQDAPFLLNAAKVILDEVSSKGNYIFSGSQKWELMKGLSESLAGTVSILEMTTLSMREIKGIDFNKPFSLDEKYITERGKKIVSYDQIWNYIHNGFYPELYNDNSRSWENYYRDYVATYIEKDVYDILKIKDQTSFYRFLISCAARTGNILNYTNIADDIGIDSETVKSWIGVLEKTGIVYLLQPYYNSHLNRAIKTPKIYFRDTGLAAYLTSWTTADQLKNGAMNGAFFETFVVNEIIKSYINVGKDYKNHIYYYKGKDARRVNGETVENEIDLILEENSILHPIEIKKNANVRADMARAFPVLDKDIEKHRGMGAIICSSEYKLQLRDNLIVLPIEYL